MIKNVTDLFKSNDNIFFVIGKTQLFLNEQYIKGGYFGDKAMIYNEMIAHINERETIFFDIVTQSQKAKLKESISYNSIYKDTAIFRDSKRENDVRVTKYILKELNRYSTIWETDFLSGIGIIFFEKNYIIWSEGRKKIYATKRNNPEQRLWTFDVSVLGLPEKVMTYFNTSGVIDNDFIFMLSDWSIVSVCLNDGKINWHLNIDEQYENSLTKPVHLLSVRPELDKINKKLIHPYYEINMAGELLKRNFLSKIIDSADEQEWEVWKSFTFDEEYIFYSAYNRKNSPISGRPIVSKTHLYLMDRQTMELVQEFKPKKKAFDAHRMEIHENRFFYLDHNKDLHIFTKEGKLVG